MSIRIINGKVYKNGTFSEEDLVLKEGKISSAEDENADEVYDAKGKYVVPGFIDVHTHGGAGVDVNAADQQGFEKIGHFFATQGTTSWLSSILTDTKEQTLKTINEAVKHQEAQKNGHENCADLLGIHLEGPFLAPEYKGAMPEHLLISPDLELLKEYQKAADGNIRYITVSPEVKGVPEAIKGMTDLGMKVAIGHSGADYDTSWKCINEGAVAATHTFNAMKLHSEMELLKAA